MNTYNVLYNFFKSKTYQQFPNFHLVYTPSEKKKERKDECNNYSFML
jgi:hypothetical protein